MSRAPQKVIVIGAGGHGKVVADIVLESGDELIGFLDGVTPQGEYMGFPILGRDTDCEKFCADCLFVVAVGNPTDKEKLVEKIGAKIKYYTAIHPAAVISPLGTEIGAGTVVAANAVINPGCRIGKHAIINTASSVDHDSVIGDFSHVAPGAHLAGGVSVGRRVWIGVGAVVKDHIRIGDDVTLGAGAAAVKPLPDKGIYVGVPAKKIS